MEQSDPFIKELYNPALEKLKQIISETSEKNRIRVVTETLLGRSTSVLKKVDPEIKKCADMLKTHIDTLDSEKWLQSSKKDIYTDGTLDEARFGKIKQWGNLSLSQPNGGFNLVSAMSNEEILQQYANAVTGKTPILIVITEPFRVDSIGQTTYNVFPNPDRKTSTGFYFNTEFDKLYKIQPSSIILPYRCLVFEVIPNTEGKEIIRIANWHGNSSNSSETEFIDFYKSASQQKIHYIMGDSNITESKSKDAQGKSYSILDVLKKLNREYGFQYTCSQHPIKKERYENDIFINNQIEKNKGKPEVDGMFIVKLNLNVSPAANVSPASGLSPAAANVSPAVNGGAAAVEP